MTSVLSHRLSSRKNSSKVTIDNIRRILSSFFSWLEDEDYILKVRVRRIHKVKSASTIKETYSDEALETMRDSCENLRDLALIDILASTGMRVGELVLLNRDDVNFEERECVVFGKGSKERIVYFDARAKIHLQNYLNARNDDNRSLFVSLKHLQPFENRGVEVRLRELGKKLNLPKVHPHKFRRTLATMAIDKGIPWTTSATSRTSTNRYGPCNTQWSSRAMSDCSPKIHWIGDQLWTIPILQLQNRKSRNRKNSIYFKFPNTMNGDIMFITPTELHSDYLSQIKKTISQKGLTV